MQEKRFINTQTGEIIKAPSQFSAYLYFKRESVNRDFSISTRDVKPFEC